MCVLSVLYPAVKRPRSIRSITDQKYAAREFACITNSIGRLKSIDEGRQPFRGCPKTKLEHSYIFVVSVGTVKRQKMSVFRQNPLNPKHVLGSKNCINA